MLNYNLETCFFSDPLGNAGPDCRNLSSVSTSVNGKTNKDLGIGNDGTKPSDEALRSSNDDDQSKKHVELPRLEESQVQSVLGDSSGESDVMEQDVSVSFNLKYMQVIY